MGTSWIAAVFWRIDTSYTEKSFEEWPHERKVAADNRNAHFHEGPATSIYLRVGCVVRSECDESCDSDSAGYTNTGIKWAFKIVKEELRFLQAAEQEDAHERNFSPNVDL